MAVWDDLFSERDTRVYAAREALTPRKPRGLGERPALLVIDMEIGSVGEDRPIYEQLDRYPLACGPFAWESIRYLQQLIPQARTAGIPVIYTWQIYRAVHNTPWRIGLGGRPASDDKDPFSELNPQSQIQPEVAPAPGDLIVEKFRPSGFFETPMLSILLARQVDTLLITGNSTSGCVRATTVDASYYPFKINVVEECVFDRIELAHKAALHDIHVKYGDVLPMSEVMAYLQRIEASKAAVRV